MGTTLVEDGTLVTCDICASSVTTSKPNGVVPDDWMTGHLWIDISLSEQRQIPLCFCPDCKPRVLTDLALVLM